MSQPSFQIKGSVLSSLVLHLKRLDPNDFEADLKQKVQQASSLLSESPILCNFDSIDAPIETEEVKQLLASAKQYKLRIIGLTGHRSDLPEIGKQLNLAVIAPQAPHAKLEKTEERYLAPLLIDKPVRSGQQIYARDRDLIILAPVSAGAECVADGSIHIYNTLRGKAIAGMNGNAGARIYCARLEAEMLAVASQFVLVEELDRQYFGTSIQAYIDQQQLVVTPITFS